MARPPKLAIHDPLYQVKDFFIDKSMRRIIPKNPYNVLWIIEHAFNNDDKYKIVKKAAIEAIKNNEPVDHKIYPIQLKEALIDDKWVIKRVKELHRDYSVDISQVALKAIRIGSNEIIKELLDLGLDPNYVDSAHRTTLSTCINRKKGTILNTYFNHPKTNRYMLNDQGENVAFSCVRYNNWKFLSHIIDVEPNLLLTLSNKNQTIFDLLGEDYSGKEIFSTIPVSLKEQLEKIIDYMYEKKFNLTIPNKGAEVIEFIVSKNYLRLQNDLPEKETTRDLTRKI